MARSWDAYLTERDLKHHELSGFGKKGDDRAGFGDNPALLVIDDYYSVLGLEREDIFESIKKWPSSCGLEGWAAIDKTAELIASARANGIPVMYVRGFDHFDSLKQMGHWGSRAATSKPRPDRRQNLTEEEARMSMVIVDEVAPQPGDLVLEKAAASAFHGTPLLFQLNYLGIDTVIACGETTSGCVRASVVDGATFRFRMGVVEECTFDRTEASHYINLFDMHSKYADVVFLDEAKAYFDSIGAKKHVPELAAV